MLPRRNGIDYLLYELLETITLEGHLISHHHLPLYYFSGHPRTIQPRPRRLAGISAESQAFGYYMLSVVLCSLFALSNTLFTGLGIGHDYKVAAEALNLMD